MMMAIAASNHRQVQLFLEAALFYLGEECAVVGSVELPVLFFLTSLICSFIQWTTPNLILSHSFIILGVFPSSVTLCLSMVE